MNCNSAVFCDSNVFFKTQFDFYDEDMLMFLNITRRLNIEKWITPITINEVNAGILNKFENFNSSYIELSTIFNNSFDDNNLIDFKNIQRAKEDVLLEFSSFVKQSGFVNIDYDVLDCDSISMIFNYYFNNEGCFTPKKSKYYDHNSKVSKNHQFPDAFQIEMIKSVAKSNQNVFIVSSDSDFGKAFKGCKNIEIIKTIDLFNKKFYNCKYDDSDFILKLEKKLISMLNHNDDLVSIFDKLEREDYLLREEDIKLAIKNIKLKRNYNLSKYESDIINDLYNENPYSRELCF